MEKLYEIYFKDVATDTEELIFTTDSLSRAKTGADANFEQKKDRGSVYVKLDQEIIYTCS